MWYIDSGHLVCISFVVACCCVCTRHIAGYCLHWAIGRHVLVVAHLVTVVCRGPAGGKHLGCTLDRAKVAAFDS